MKALIQRVRRGSVSVDGATVGRIGPGYVVLLGVVFGLLALSSPLTMAADTGRLGAILLAQTKQANGTIQLEAWATQRNVSGMPSAAPIPTFTPLPTMTPIPTSTPRPTPTVKPQLPTQPETHSTQSNLLKGQSPLILSGGLAAMIVIGALAMRAVLITRRR
jgi:hypothetical protein